MPYYPNYPQYPQMPNGYAPTYQPMYQPTYAPQTQTVAQSAQTFTAPQGLNGKYVDGIETVKATDVMMDGSVMYFPATDGRTIFTKQLQPDGTSRIAEYVLKEAQPEQAQPTAAEIIDDRLKAFRGDMRDDMNARLDAFADDLGDRLDKIEKKLRAKTTRGDDE